MTPQEKLLKKPFKIKANIVWKICQIKWNK